MTGSAGCTLDRSVFLTRQDVFDALVALILAEGDAMKTASPLMRWLRDELASVLALASRHGISVDQVIFSMTEMPARWREVLCVIRSALDNAGVDYSDPLTVALLARLQRIRELHDRRMARRQLALTAFDFRLVLRDG